MFVLYVVGLFCCVFFCCCFFVFVFWGGVNLLLFVCLFVLICGCNFHDLSMSVCIIFSRHSYA